ncbi:hypothetical protein C8R44DRAFT_744603 [Mycena epipterygia]|nr:hypothetical protein C8R44DRAFT_745442 [Mycena epipterygia]KAJ7107405.1 hypothetical protein C8R44DRAFT_744603 [Mycena epipterygia]
MPKTKPKSSRANRKKVNLSVRTAVNITDSSGTVTAKLRTLNPKDRLEVEKATREELKKRLAALSKVDRQKLDRLRDIPDDLVEWTSEEMGMQDYQDVLDGHVQMDISHGGGEMGDMQDALNEEMNSKKRRKRQDTRSRWDSVQRRVLGFRAQMQAMTDAYMKWVSTQGEQGMEAGPVPPPEDMVETEYVVKVVDIFSAHLISLLQSCAVC